MNDKNKYPTNIDKIVFSVIILLIGIGIGIYIEEPIAYEYGKLEQSAFDAGFMMHLPLIGINIQMVQLIGDIMVMILYIVRDLR